MNSTVPTSDNEEQFEGKWVCQIMTAEGVIGVLGNLLVCFVILRAKCLHNLTNYLLVNLAVADMLLCLHAFIYYLVTAEGCALISFVPASQGGRQIFCRLLASRFSVRALSYASAYNLCVVTLERYVAIVHPLQYERKLTATRMKTLITLIWMISFVLSLPILFTIYPSDDPEQACSEITYPHQMFPLILNIGSFILGYLVPVTSMSLAYYKMQVTLKRQAKALRLQQAREAAYDLVIARQRLVSVLTIVLGAFVILLTPGFVTYLLCLHPTANGPFSFCASKYYRYTREICNLAYYLNSVINPIIYEFKYKKFRKALKSAFCSCFKKHNRNRVDIAMVPL
ncbi:neuromedin-U receptor 2-like [Patiria miniata]|uniref:G-protein coupled receptors family 1 profile domain-containing protein n=1 Tax=Patiria miniata TaxID=46514 RepID=A0A913Z295_PATMI|nr:neuromedin-U receptor 2-like [Patiria miniata]